MKLLLYRTDDLEGEPFQVIDNVSFNTPYNITGMASNTDYSVVLLDDFNEVVDLSSSTTSYTTLDTPRGFGYTLKEELNGDYPVTLYDQNEDEVTPDYYHVFLDHDGNFEALADPLIDPISITPDYIVDVTSNDQFPIIDSPYCIVAMINGSTAAISEVIEP